MIEYSIQRTNAGRFLVRRQDGREMAKFGTEAEARADVAARIEADAHKEREREARALAQRAFDASVPNLNTLQLHWQEWRGRLYDYLQYEGRRLERARCHLDGMADNTGPSYMHHEGVHTQEARRHAEATALYERAVALDNLVKAARRAHDAAALEDALAEAIPLCADMAAYCRVQYDGPPLSLGAETRTDLVRVRLTTSEREILIARANMAGQTLSEYIRTRCL